MQPKRLRLWQQQAAAAVAAAAVAARRSPRCNTPAPPTTSSSPPTMDSPRLSGTLGPPRVKSCSDEGATSVAAVIADILGLVGVPGPCTTGDQVPLLLNAAARGPGLSTVPSIRW